MSSRTKARPPPQAGCRRGTSHRSRHPRVRGRAFRRRSGRARGKNRELAPRRDCLQARQLLKQSEDGAFDAIIRSEGGGIRCRLLAYSRRAGAASGLLSRASGNPPAKPITDARSRTVPKGVYSRSLLRDVPGLSAAAGLRRAPPDYPCTGNRSGHFRASTGCGSALSALLGVPRSEPELPRSEHQPH